MNGYLLRKMALYILIAGLVLALFIGITLGNYLPEYASIQEPHPLRWIFAFGAFGICSIISSIMYTGGVIAEIIDRNQK